MNFQPRFDGYRTKVHESFDKQKFMAHIGAQLLKVKPGYCEISVPFNEDLTQQDGFFHAGIISTIADNVAGYAAFSLFEKDASVLTVEIKLNLLAPGKGDRLLGKGQVLKNGRTLTVCRSDVYVVTGAAEKLCAVGQSTLIQLRKPKNNS